MIKYPATTASRHMATGLCGLTLLGVAAPFTVHAQEAAPAAAPPAAAPPATDATTPPAETNTTVTVTGHSKRSCVAAARDAGITEFVAKPLTARSLLARMEAAVVRPRPFVRCRNYMGPDRRRRREQPYAGPYRRAADGLI